MKLELKHLAPYLPYGLKVIPYEWRVNEFWQGKKVQLEGFKLDNVQLGRAIFTHPDLMTDINRFGIVSFNFDEIQPILRPLSDLAKEIDDSGTPETYIDIIGQKHYIEWDDVEGLSQIVSENDEIEQVEDLQWLTYHTTQLLFEYHFDVFGLIDKGLAIDINTLK